MTARERFVKTLGFGRPDRIFYYFGKPRKATLDAWRLQGLPPMPDAGEYGCPQEFLDLVGFDHFEWSVGVDFGPCPSFELRVIKEDDRHCVWVDRNGITILDAGRALETPGFRTRSFLRHPVSNREQWLAMRERFDPHSPDRFPQDWTTRAKQLNARDWPIMLVMPGLFCKARDWVGFENLCLLCYDAPALVEDMMEHTTVFLMDIVERVLRDVPVEGVILSEDMAYKHASMISPAMFRRFMLPRYQRMVRLVKGHGLLVFVDCDGHLSQLLPLWQEAGIDGTYPIEIAAANDPLVYRRQYPRFALFGGIDKREIRTLEQTHREIMGKVPWLIEQGGYLPSIDHAVPPDVPLRSYLYMCELIKRLATGRPLPSPGRPLEIFSRLEKSE